MSADEHLSPSQFFHGTTREGLEEVLPATAHGGGVTFPHDTDRRHAYATTSQDNAWHYAEKAWNASGSGIPRVYQVEPLGDHEQDPQVENGRLRGNFSNDRRSTTGWRVLSEVQMPEHMGPAEDWR